MAQLILPATVKVYPLYLHAFMRTAVSYFFKILFKIINKHHLLFYIKSVLKYLTMNSS